MQGNELIVLLARKLEFIEAITIVHALDCLANQTDPKVVKKYNKECINEAKRLMQGIKITA